MAREVTIAAVQLPQAAAAENATTRITRNLATACAWLEKAGQRQADIACLGEIFNVLGVELTPQNTTQLVENACAGTIERLSPLARRYTMYLIAPILALLDGKIRNVALLFDRTGAVIGQYLKVHCIENERHLGVVPGAAWPTFELDFGKIGIQICHDNSFPESARCLTLNGAEIIFWPHVMSGWGGEFMDLLLRSPAIHNGIYHVPVCFGCDVQQAWRPGMLIGRSSIIAPDGLILADAGRYPGIALTRVDLDQPRLATGFTRNGDFVWKIDMRNDRRPETYQPIVAPWTPIPPIPADAANPPLKSKAP